MEPFEIVANEYEKRAELAGNDRTKTTLLEHAEKIRRAGRKRFSRDKLRSHRITVSLNDEELKAVVQAVGDAELAAGSRELLLEAARARNAD